MTVSECMTKEVITIKRSTTLSQIIETFQKYNFHTLPVVGADNRLVGIVNFEDIIKVFQPYSIELTTMLKTVPFLEMELKEDDFLGVDISSEIGILIVADDIMNTHVATVEPEIDIKKARTLMKLHNMAHLPVVNKDGILVGMISLFDIILAVFRERGVI